MRSAQSKFDGHAHHGNVYGFTGEQWDQDTGLLYLRARYYQPETGRFTSRDSFRGFEEVPLTFHKYIYGLNNPYAYIDFDGAIPENLAENQAIFDVMASREAEIIANRWAAELGVDIYAKSVMLLLLKAAQKNWASAVPYLRVAYWVFRFAGATEKVVKVWEDYRTLRRIYIVSYKYWRAFDTAKYLYFCQEWGLSPTGPLLVGPRF